jgi:hypothetical protein
MVMYAIPCPCSNSSGIELSRATSQAKGGDVMSHGVQRWLLAIMVLLMAGFVYTPAVSAQCLPGTPGDCDHLTCYTIKDPNPSQKKLVLLENQFGVEQCVVLTRASHLCAETAKFSQQNPNGDDPRRDGPVGHYLCYPLSGCPRARVSDQFDQPTIGRVVNIPGASLLCTPAKKELLP